MNEKNDFLFVSEQRRRLTQKTHSDEIQYGLFHRTLDRVSKRMKQRIQEREGDNDALHLFNAVLHEFSIGEIMRAMDFGSRNRRNCHL